MKKIQLTLRLTGLLLAGGAFASAESLRLKEIPAVRFTRPAEQTVIERGILNAAGTFRVTSTNPIAHDPGAARDKVVIHTEAWFAYLDLGEWALANFVRPTGNPLTVGGLIYYEVGAAKNARFDLGDVVNLSTRGQVSANAADGSLVGGFVIREQARRVLIRAAGPSLTPHGVAGAVADPYLTLYHQGLPLYFNGDWGNRPDAAEIAAKAAELGAFPFNAGSKDAALLVELPPGAYTAQVTTETGAPGIGLVEVYIVP